MRKEARRPDPAPEEIERRCEEFRKHWPAKRFPQTAVPARTMEISTSEFNAVVAESEER